ncbi:MAG: ribonuclease P protein component [Bacteroidales bacterium]|nr:ribonuclease P protein component [Bacteroidales bacterium]
MPKIYGLSKNEKLKSVVRTDKLFTQGKSFWIFPFNVYYRIGSKEELFANQFLVSVGKHYFKHAVDRNRTKRLVREAYRLNKNIVYEVSEKNNVCFNVGFVYKSRTICDFATVQKSVLQALENLAKEIAEKNQK